MILYEPPKTRNIVLRAAVAILLGYAAYVFMHDARAQSEQANLEDAKLRTDTLTPSKKSPVHIYFADRSNYFLMSEQRVVLHQTDPASFAKAIVEALIKGPQKGLLRTIPTGTQLQAIFVSANRVCYVDLSEAVSKNHPGGSNTELLTIYSIVNSLVLNIPEIERVKILVNGNEVPTLAGHIDLRLPLKANMLLVR